MEPLRDQTAAVLDGVGVLVEIDWLAMGKLVYVVQFRLRFWAHYLLLEVFNRFSLIVAYPLSWLNHFRIDLTHT